MKKYTINKKLRQLRCANTGQRGPCIELPPASRATIENTMLLVEGLLGCSPAANVLAAHALEVYLLRLTHLLNEAAAIQSKPHVSEGRLLNLMDRIQREREGMFLAAGKPDARWDSEHGKCPSAEEITGHKLNIPELAKRTGILLKVLIKKLNKEVA